MSLIPSSKSNPCPVCEDILGKCRQGREDQDYWQCMSYADTRKGEVIGGYKCIGHTRDRLWGQFRLDNTQEWTDQQRLEWKARNEQRRQEKAKEDVERRRRSLSTHQRHEQYTRLLNELILHPDDRADLVSRGFTHEQIELAEFRSVESYQKLQSQFSTLLPGIGATGRELVVKHGGYLCPVRSADGLIVGCQIRLRTLPDGDSNRYRWLSSKGQTLHLFPEECKSEGELPLAVFRPEGKPEGIALAEGTGPKPFLVSQRLNLLTIGAAGGQWASSPELFRSTLKKAALEVKGKSIKIFPDAGDILNESVMSRWQRVTALLQEWGWSVRVGWWGQVTKDHPDIDELNDLSIINFITPEEFLSWAGREGIDKSASRNVSTQKASISNQPTSSNKSQKPGNSPLNKTNQELLSSLQYTILDISNPPLIALSPIQSLKDGISRVLPIPESVASCLTTEEKAPRAQRKWFERVLNRIKKVFLRNAKKDKTPRLGFKCFKEDNPNFEEKIRQVQRKLRSLSYDADIHLTERYLPNELVSQLPKSGLIGIKAPKGCGKSVLLKKIITLAKKQGIPVLSITPRIALGREQAIKWEITWIDDYGVMQTRAGDTTSQIKEVAEKRAKAREKLTELENISHHQLNLLGNSEITALEQQKADLRIEIERYGEEIENINSASVKTLALCWDSLWRTKDRDFKEGLIIIDEAELGFQHFISGSTCKRNRPQLLQTFKAKLIECLMSGGRVILSDADLTDLPINYIREILPIPIKPFIVTNDYIGDDTRWIVDLRTGSRGTTLTEIIQAVGDGKYLAITTDSQAEAQALESRILQELPDDFCAFLDSEGNITNDAQARKKALIVRVDRTTTESEAGKKFIQKPNQQISHWQPRILIYTPSMGVGISVDESTQRWDEEWEEAVPYFDAVYGLFLGVIVPSQCRQQLARVRANVPRIVSCKESNRALEGCSSFFPDEVKRQTLKYNHTALSIIDVAKGIAGYEADDEQIREAMLQLLTEAWDKDSRCWREPSIDLASAFKARENYDLWNLANLLREELQNEGHTVISLSGAKTDLVGQIADIKDDLKMEEATLIAESLPMPVDEARKIINKLGATKDEYRSAQKALLQEELPEVDLTPAFIKKAVIDDRRRWLNQHKLFWYFSNDEALRQIDTDHWLSNLKRFAEGTPFMRDIRSHGPKVQALRKSGIFEFVSLEDCDRIYEGDTPEAQKFLKQCLKEKDLLQTALNLIVTKKSSPIGLAGRILGKVGLGLEKLTRSHKDKRWKLSADLVTDPDRANTLKALELRWQMSQEEAIQKLAEKQAQTQTQQVTQPGGQPAIYIYTNQSCPPNINEVSQGEYEHSQTGGEVTAAVTYSEPQKSPQNQTQQATQPGGQPAIYINQKTSYPPNINEVSQVEELVTAFEFCQSVSDFAAVIEEYPVESVEDAIAFASTQPRRRQLSQWFEELSSDIPVDSPLPEEPPIEVSKQVNPVEGCRVRVKQRLLDNRRSLMMGLEGVLTGISALGRITVEALGRIEYFDQSEVEVLSGA